MNARLGYNFVEEFRTKPDIIYSKYIPCRMIYDTHQFIFELGNWKEV